MKNLLNLFYLSIIPIASLITIYFIFMLIEILSLYNIDNLYIKSIFLSLFLLLNIISTMCLINGNKTIFKVFCLLLFIVLSVLIVFYIMNKTGLTDKIKSVEDLREYIASFKSNASLIYILIQFLQVTILPIPSLITLGAGVLLFGVIKGAIYSIIGIVLGSIFSFFIGRLFGYKLISWLFEKKKIDNLLKILNKKNKVLLTFMFLFPFFPDDLLCLLSGLTSMSPIFFIIMLTIVRIITVFTSSFTLNNSLIPYNTWWGIAFYILFFILTIYLAINILKNDKFFINKIFDRSKESK